MPVKFARRHYEVVAKAMVNIHPGIDVDTIDYHARLEMWADVRASLCEEFMADNPAFNYTKFVVACLPNAAFRAGSHE